MTLMDRLARIGAPVRLANLRAEEAQILKAFPDLKLKPVKATLKKRRRMSRAARARMSAGMRKYWAKRHAAEKATA